jgi:hypothetical protein
MPRSPTRRAIPSKEVDPMNYELSELSDVACADVHWTVF